MLLPRPDHGVVAAKPPGTGPGYWAGAPCAVAGDGEIFLAYRLRRPIAQGRGYASPLPGGGGIFARPRLLQRRLSSPRAQC